MDPLSIAASSAGLVSLCTAISKVLYRFISDSRVVDQALAAFHDEIEELSGFLASIESSFGDDRTAKAVLRETTGHEQQHWAKAKRSMEDCHRTLERLSKLLERVRGDHGQGFFSRQQKQMKLDMNSAEIVVLRQQIQSYKDTMKLSFHVITISLMLTGQTSNANIINMLNGLTRDVRDLHQDWRSHPAPEASSHRYGDNNALAAKKNQEDYLSSARSLIITASVLSNASGSVRGKSEGNPGIEEWINDLESEPNDRPSAVISTSSRSQSDVDKLSKSETSERDPAPRNDGPDSPNTEQCFAYRLPRTTSISQYSQIQLSPEVLMFIDECEKVQQLCREGDRQEASRLGIAFLKTLVRNDVEPEKWEDVEKNILHAKEKGLASSGYGFTVLHLLALNDLGQYIRVLLGKGANINAIAGDGCTPLHISSWSGHYRMSKLLIENNAIINAKTKDHRTPLHFACQEGRRETAELLIRNGAHLEAKDLDHRTPLCYACRRGHLETASLLIDNGAHLEVKAINYLSPLYYACGSGHLETARLLINKGASIEARTKDSCTPLHIASLNGHDAVVQLLLEHRAHVDVRDREQRTPLCCASWNNHHSVAKLLLSNQPPKACKKMIDAKLMDNATSLHISCQRGHLETAKLLIGRGADLQAKDKDGRTPLYLACRYGQYEMVSLLIEHKADLEASSKDRRTPLHAASEHNQAHVVKLLLEHGACIEAKSEDQGTPLYASCRSGHIKTVQMLIDAGAKVNAKALKNYTPLHIACRHGHKSVVELLLDRGANIEEKDKKQRTPLRIACEYGHEDTLRMLLVRGANIEAKSEFNYTPLHSACWSGHVGVVRLLVKHGANTTAKTIDRETPKSIARKHNADSSERIVQLEMALEGKG